MAGARPSGTRRRLKGQKARRDSSDKDNPAPASSWGPGLSRVAQPPGTSTQDGTTVPNRCVCVCFPVSVSVRLSVPVSVWSTDRSRPRRGEGGGEAGAKPCTRGNRLRGPWTPRAVPGVPGHGRHRVPTGWGAAFLLGGGLPGGVRQAGKAKGRDSPAAASSPAQPGRDPIGTRLQDRIHVRLHIHERLRFISPERAFL